MARPTETTRLISSLGVFSGRLEAATREIGRSSQAMKLMADQQARFSNQAAAAIKDAVTDAMKASMDQAARTVASGLPYPPDVVIPDFVPGDTGPTRGRTRPAVPPDPSRTTPATHGRTRRAEPLPPDEDPGGKVQPAHRYEYEGAYKNYRGYRMESLQKDVGHKVTEMLQGRQERVMDHIEAEHGFRKNAADQWIHSATGRFASKAEREGMDAALERAASRYGTARNVTTAIAEGQGVKQAIMGALPAGLIKKAGITAAVLGVTDQALDFATQQREQNRRWQQITGEGNLSGFRERARSQGFEWSMKGTMGAGMASELYMGAAELGLRGDDRNRALDFAVANFKKHGMDVRDSLSLISTALESSNANLTGLSEALKVVGDQAKAAGRNVGEAQKAFAQRYESITPTIGGAPAVALAAGQQAAAVSLGRGLEGVQFGTGVTDMRVQAAMLGMTLPQFMEENTRTGGVTSAQGEAKRMAMLINPRLGPEGQQRLAEFTREHGDPSTWNTAEARQFGESLTDLIDPQAMQGLLGAAGMPGISFEKAPQVIGEVLSGRLPTQLVEKTADAAGDRLPEYLKREGDTRTQQTGGQSSGIIRGPNFFGGSDRRIQTSVSKDTVKEIKGDIGWRDKAPMWGRHGKTQMLADARRLYLEKVTKEGGKAKADPKIEALLKEGYKGKFIVQTSDGDKAVNFEDAINHYWDQLRAGTAEIGEGEHKGETVASAFGVEEDASVNVTSDDKKGKVKGEDAEDYKKKVDDKDRDAGGKVHGKVVIEMEPGLRKLLHINPSGDVIYTDPNSPKSTNGSSRQLPGTTGGN